MTNIREVDLGQPLLAFTFAFYILTVLWAEVRKHHPQIVAMVNNGGINKRSVRKGQLYRLLIMGFSTIVMCYTLYPFVYSHFIPITVLDNVWVNICGVLLLLLSMIWIVIAQLDFDNEISSAAAVNTNMWLDRVAIYSKKIRLGYLFMFTGITITLANLLSALLLFVAICIYRDR